MGVDVGRSVGVEVGGLVGVAGGVDVKVGVAVAASENDPHDARETEMT